MKTIILILFISITTTITNNSGGGINVISFNNNVLLYENVWGTIYHPTLNQCDDTPTITGDGSRINPGIASKHRWIAISQNMLNCIERKNILKNPNSDRFTGKIKYGDIVFINSPYPEINGYWTVHDVKNKRYRNSIDFLQTVGDNSLYRRYSNWSGKFNDIQIYKYNLN